jgi:hypothetical protein
MLIVATLSFQTRLTQTKPVLPLSNEHGPQVNDQGRRQCCYNKHKHFPIGLHVMYLYFPDRPRIKLYDFQGIQLLVSASLKWKNTG